MTASSATGMQMPAAWAGRWERSRRRRARVFWRSGHWALRFDASGSPAFGSKRRGHRPPSCRVENHQVSAAVSSLHRRHYGGQRLGDRPAIDQAGGSLPTLASSARRRPRRRPADGRCRRPCSTGQRCPASSTRAASAPGVAFPAPPASARCSPRPALDLRANGQGHHPGVSFLRSSPGRPAAR